MIVERCTRQTSYTSETLISKPTNQQNFFVLASFPCIRKIPSRCFRPLQRQNARHQQELSSGAIEKSPANALSLPHKDFHIIGTPKQSAESFSSPDQSSCRFTSFHPASVGEKHCIDLEQPRHRQPPCKIPCPR